MIPFDTYVYGAMVALVCLRNFFLQFLYPSDVFDYIRQTISIRTLVFVRAAMISYITRIIYIDLLNRGIIISGFLNKCANKNFLFIYIYIHLICIYIYIVHFTIYSAIEKGFVRYRISMLLYLTKYTSGIFSEIIFHSLITPY